MSKQKVEPKKLPQDIRTEPVVSSKIKEVGYDDPTDTAVIVFSNGAKYAYFDVSYEDYQHLLQAPSIGKHHGEYWKKFRYERLS